MSLLKTILYLLMVATLAIPSYSQAPLPALDTFAPGQHTGDSYALALKAHYKAALKAKDTRAAQAMLPHIQALKAYTFADSFELRKAYARYAYLANHVLQDPNICMDYYTRAHHLLHTAADKAKNWVMYVENPLGIQYIIQGDCQKAEYFLKLAMQEQERRSNMDQSARIASNLSIAWITNQEYEKAINLSNLALDYCSETNDQGRFHHHSVLATAHSMLGNHQIARAHIIHCDSINQAGQLGHDLMVNIQWRNYYSEIDSLDNALRKAKEIITLHHNSKRRNQAKDYRYLASIYNNDGQPRLARQALDSALHILNNGPLHLSGVAEAMYPENNWSETLETYGDTYRNTNQDSALYCYQLALDAWDLAVQNTSLEDSKLNNAGNNRHLINKVLEVYSTKGKIENWQKVRRYFAESKNQLLSHKNQILTHLQNTDQRAYENYLQNEAEIRYIQANYEIEDTEQFAQLMTLAKANHDIEATYQSTVPYFEGLFLDYVFTNDALLVLDNFNGYRITSLPRYDELESLLSDFEAQIVEVTEVAQLNQLASQLYEILLQPLAPLPAEFSVFTDGPLDRLPFDVLQHDGQYIIENHIIAYRLSHYAATPSKEAATSIYAIAPNYGAATSDQVYTRSDIYPLRFSQKEVKDISDLFASKAVKSDLDLANIKDGLTKYDVLHFAGHARPHMQYGCLIGGEEIANKAILGSEIAGIHSAAQLVVLSACETGVGRESKGEGSMSLARAFVQGGSQSVVNSLWTVNDQTTARIMNNFYHHYISDGDATEALRQAKLDYLAHADDHGQHPYYWSGFAAIESTSDPSKTWLPYLLISILALLLLMKTKTK